MKNLTLFPLERNGYFTGKLLTARDFDAEQQYMNDKRRLQNRFLGGVGVVCGMHVSRYGDAGLRVESGLALDGSGREVIIPKPTTRSISELDGFQAADKWGISCLYLCVEYAEQCREPQRGITGNSYDEPDYGRLAESYRLFLTHEEPVLSGADGHHGHNKSLEVLFAERLTEHICIAKIRLVRRGAGYQLGSIEPLPFGFLTGGRGYAGQGLAGSDPGCGADEQKSRGHAGAERKAKLVSSGTATVRIPDGARSGQTFFSESISHGLGPGEVFLTLGLLEDGAAVFGSPAVFTESAGFEIAARADFAMGDFLAGVRLKKEVCGGELHLSWMAVRMNHARDGGEKIPRITVLPATVTLKPLEVVNFSAELANVTGSEVVWSVMEKGGGYVDSFGRYSAPAAPGVYAIIARSVKNPELSCVAYAVVEQ